MTPTLYGEIKGLFLFIKMVTAHTPTKSSGEAHFFMSPSKADWVRCLNRRPEIELRAQRTSEPFEGLMKKFLKSPVSRYGKSMSESKPNSPKPPYMAHHR